MSGWRTRVIEACYDAAVEHEDEFSGPHWLRNRSASRRRSNVSYNFGAGRAAHLANSRRQYERDIERCRVEYDAFKRRWSELVPLRRCIGMDRFRRSHRQAWRLDGDLVISRIAQSLPFERTSPVVGLVGGQRVQL
jgi:hypothetical protein